MGLLDQLLEKKDLFIYIDEKIKLLKKTRRKQIKYIKEKQREEYKHLIEGRIRELYVLKSAVSEGELKELSIKMWKENRKTEKKKEKKFECHCCGDEDGNCICR